MTLTHLPADTHPPKLLPELNGQLQAITDIQVNDATDHRLVTLHKTDHGWQVIPLDFPADPSQVATLLDQLNTLTVVALKTADPSRFADLGVAEVTLPTPVPAHSPSLRLHIEGIQPAIDLLIGQPAGSLGSYVRRRTESHVSEVRPAIRLPRSPLEWVDHTLIDLAETAIQSIDIQRVDATSWQIHRQSPEALHTEVSPPLTPRELPFAGAADPLLKNFSPLSLVNLRAASAASQGTDRSVVKRFDGFDLTVIRQGRESPCWVRLNATWDPTHTGDNDRDPKNSAVVQRVAQFNARHHDWEYQLSSERCSALFQKRSDLLRITP